MAPPAAERVGDVDARQRGEAFPQCRGDRRQVPGDGVDAQGAQVGERCPQAQAQGVRGFPQLEPFGVRHQFPAALGDPPGTPDIGRLGGEPVQEGTADSEHPGAARSAQELAAGPDEQVAAEGVHVDRQLPERLRRVQQEGHSMGLGQRTDSGGGFDKTGRGGHMGRGHQGGGTGAQRRLQGLQIHRAVRAVGQQLHPDTVVALGRQQVQRAADVAGAGRQHPVPGAEPQRRHRALPADRRALDEGDLLRPGAEEFGDTRVDGGQGGSGVLCGLVAPGQALGPEVVDDRLDRAGGEQGRAERR